MGGSQRKGRFLPGIDPKAPILSSTLSSFWDHVSHFGGILGFSSVQAVVSMAWDHP